MGWDIDVKEMVYQRLAIRELQDYGFIEKTRLGFIVTSSEDTVAMYEPPLKGAELAYF